MVKEKWISTHIKDIATIYGRIGFRGYTKQDIVKPGFGAISLSPSNIKDGKVTYAPATYISWEKYEESPEIKLTNGDVVLVKTGSTFGKTAYIDRLPWPTTLNPQIVVFKKLKIHAKLFAYFIASKNIQEQIGAVIVGGAIPTLSQEQVYAFDIVYPPDAKEQAAIAEALSDIDSLIFALQQLIEKKKAIKQGTMQELLSGKKRLPGFCQKWAKKYLKEIIAPRKERINPAEIDNRRCIELEHIEPNSGKILGYCESKEQKSLKTIFYPNDILWGKLRPYLRKYAHPKFSGVCSTEFWVFNAIDQYACNDFMYYLLQTEDFVSAANSTTGTKMPRADWNLVQELEVKIPADKNEQRAIAQVLSDMDSEIEQLEKKLAKYQQIKQGMMQELLTGRIRLV